MSNCLSPFRGDGREVRKCSTFVLISDPLYLPLKRGGPVWPPLESPRKVFWMSCKTLSKSCNSLSISLFRKQANCLSLFRGDGRGVKIHMKKGLLHVSRHITNLFLETRNMRKQWEYFLLTLFYLCFTKLNNRKQADMSVLTSTPSISK